MKISDFKQMSGTLWFLMLGTLFSKASYFISMPYLAVRLQTVLKLDPVTIGWTLGIGPFVGIFCGFYIGYLSDHLGRKAILVSSLFIWAATFLGFAYATELWHFALLNTINGICSAAYYPVSSALTSDLTELSQRKFIFHLRYYVINLGAAVGPLCGAWLILYNPSMGFMVTSLLYFIFAVACVSKIPADSKVKGGPPSEKVTFRETMRAILEDAPLMYYTLAFVLMGITYSQLESTLPQYLNSIFAADGIRLFGIILGVNALTVVICQLPLTKLTSGLPIVKTIMIGSLLYGIGFSLFGLIGTNPATFIVSMFILTLGEVLIFSNGNLIIDRIAPENKKGAYFGASGLWALGPTVGPALGGLILMYAGGKILFITLGVAATANILIYRLGGRAEIRRRA